MLDVPPEFGVAAMLPRPPLPPRPPNVPPAPPPAPPRPLRPVPPPHEARDAAPKIPARVLDASSVPLTVNTSVATSTSGLVPVTVTVPLTAPYAQYCGYAARQNGSVLVLIGVEMTAVCGGCVRQIIKKPVPRQI